MHAGAASATAAAAAAAAAASSSAAARGKEAEEERAAAAAAAAAEEAEEEDSGSDEDDTVYDVEAAAAVDADVQAVLPVAKRVHAERTVLSGAECPYMDTVRRELLDLDRARECSVTSRTNNIYCCLVDGKYFQGRNAQSPAYFHSLQSDAHLFLNLTTKQVYCLPEGYQVVDPSLDDIMFELDPTFARDVVEQMDKRVMRGRALGGKEVVAGLKGLTAVSSAKASNAVNAVLQMLARVSPLRDFCMLEHGTLAQHDDFVRTFASVMAKLWNFRSFRVNVNPHAFLQSAQLIKHSGRNFEPTKSADAADFVRWLLNELHMQLGRDHRNARTIVSELFRGEIEVTVEKDAAANAVVGLVASASATPRAVSTTPFLMLPLDIPAVPLFKDSFERNIIPQVHLSELLKRYDGHSVQFIRAEKRTHVFTRLPRYLLMHCKRFVKNQFFVEKNPSVVLFPLTGLNMAPYVKAAAGDGQQDQHTYRLLAVLVHDGSATEGVFRVFVLHKPSGKWYECNDTEIIERPAHTVQYCEAYMLLYERV